MSATGGALGLGTAVNGAVGGSCGAGLCQVGGGTAAGRNLFHRFSAFDTRGGITGVNFATGGASNVFVGVTSPLGTFIDKLVSFSGPTNLFWLSPGGIAISGAGGFANIQQLNLSTATGWRLGNGVFDAAGTTAGQAALLSGTPVTGLAGAVNDPASLAALGLQKNGDLSLAGGLLTVDQSLLLDAQGGNVLLQAAGIQAPGGTVEIQGHSVLQSTPISVGGANGGSVAIKASGSVINSAPIQANGSVGTGGSIAVLADQGVVQTASASLEANGVGGGGGSVKVQAGKSLFSSATLTATGSGPAGKGGTIELSAPSVTLAAAQLDASGAAGGGTVGVGGGYQGSPLSLGGASATTTSVSGSSTLKADATAIGNGGQVVVWSEQSTTFGGGASARGGPAGGDGGQLEVSGKEQLVFGGQGDASAPNGKAGSLLLDPKNIVIDATAAANVNYFVTQLVNPNPGAANGFAQQVVALSGGNIVATDPNSNAFGADSGAAYLFNGTSGALISSLTGTSAGEKVGGGGVNSGIVELSNGNYLVASEFWGNQVGAVTWGSGVTGVNGVVSSNNSLVGSIASEAVGLGGIETLSNGNYLVASPLWGNQVGAVTWGNGLTGTSGVVSSTNSLVGSTPGDLVGGPSSLFAITKLSNGNYVVYTEAWQGNGVDFKGAVTWGNGLTGVSGVVSSANSLVGSTFGDQVGSGGVRVLTNGNYVVASPGWSQSVGAATWGSGLTGVSGLVSSSNSLVGSTIGDQVGSDGVTALTNGNYVVISRLWRNPIGPPGGEPLSGAVTWGNGATGITTGAVTSSNSLVGAYANAEVGRGGVTALNNGNYVVSSPLWTASTTPFRVGAVTWSSGSSGTPRITGLVNSTNSLVGSTTDDQLGSGGVTALPNGNYVVASPQWSTPLAVASVGAVITGNGSSGTTGTVNASNSLVGSTANDRVGSGGVKALNSGNYVVSSPEWSNGSGAITWVNTVSGLTGVITNSNSLVGTTTTDRLGSGGVTALTNGNFVVGSPSWNGSIGSVTWASGTFGISGQVDSFNSLLGSTANDRIGSGGVTPLNNGRYVVSSPYWITPGGVTDAGAVTWADSASGITGVVSSSNSLVGRQSQDFVGSGGITALSNGNYVVSSPFWSDALGTTSVGAITWANGSSGVTGEVGATNSLVGQQANGHYGGVASSGGFNGYVTGVKTVSGNRFTINSPELGATGEGLLQLVTADQLTGAFSFASFPSADLAITPAQIAAIASAGTDVILQANNNITLRPGSAITIDQLGALPGGNLTLQAGRSIDLQSSISTDGANLTLLANDPAADATFRDAGLATITMVAGTTIDLNFNTAGAAAGALNLKLFPSSGTGPATAGVVSLTGLTAGLITVDARGGLTLNGPLTALSTSPLAALPNAGSSLVLNAGAGTFTNLVGPGALSSANSWLLYSNQRSSDANLLAYDFKQYGKSFDDTIAIAAAGKGVIYGVTPAPLTVSLVGTTTRAYDGTTAATVVASQSPTGNYSINGILDNDVLGFVFPTSGTYTTAGTGVGTKDVGTGKTVSVTGVALAPTQTVYGYSLASSTATGVIGEISARPLTATSINPGSSTYGSTLSPGAVNLSNIVGSELVMASASVTTSTLSTSGNPVFGSYTQSASTTLSGADAGNYSFSGFTTATPNYSINKLALSGAAIAAGSSIYGSALTPGAVSFTNIFTADAVASIAAVNTSTLSTSGNPVFGSYTQSASTTLAGADATNYSFSGFTTATPNYSINKLALSGAGVIANNKVYDGTTAATLSDSSLGGRLPGDVVVLTSGTSTFSDPNVGTGKIVTVAGAGISGPDAANYNLTAVPTSLAADINIRPLSTWVASTAGNWSDAANWDALPSGSNVAKVLIPSGSAYGAVTYDAAAGSTQLQNLINNGSLSLNGGSLAVSGFTSLFTGASLRLNGGAFSTASLANLGGVDGNGSVPLVVNGTYTEPPKSGGRLGSGFSSVSITQTSGDLNLRNVGALGPITLSSLAGVLNLSGEVTSTGGAISLSASGPIQLGSGSALTSPGALISVSSGGPLSLNGARIDASGASAGGTVQLDGSSLSLTNTTVNTSGASDGGLIQLGLKTLPSNVSITNSSLVADPPGLGGTIVVDGRAIALAGTTLNVFGLSGGSIVLGSGNTATLSLDAFTSLVGGGGASFNLFAGSILNNASIVGGKLFLNGVAAGSAAPLVGSTIPPIVSFLQTIDPIQANLTDNTVDYTVTGSPLVTQWEWLGIDPLTITLSESLFLYADVFVSSDQLELPVWDVAQMDLIQDSFQNLLYAVNLNVDRDLALLRPTFQTDALEYMMLLQRDGIRTASSAISPTGDPLPAGQAPLASAFSLRLEQQLYPSPSFAGAWPEGAQFSLSIRGLGLFDQAVQQLSPQEVNAQFAVSEQKAMEETAAKLGLDPSDGRVVPTPAELQESLRKVIEAVRDRVRRVAP